MLAKGAESQDKPPTKDALVLHVKRANFQAYILQALTHPYLTIMDGSLKTTL